MLEIGLIVAILVALACIIGLRIYNEYLNDTLETREMTQARLEQLRRGDL